MLALVDKYTPEELQNYVNQSTSMRDLVFKLGYSSKNGTTYKTIEKRLQKYNIDTSHFQERHSIKRSPENIFIENSTVTQKVLREWYYKGNYSEYKCAICNLPPIWQGNPLTLTLDHINGKSNDDRLENLRWICPNCDRQLPTYSRGAKGLISSN